MSLLQQVGGQVFQRAGGLIELAGLRFVAGAFLHAIERQARKRLKDGQRRQGRGWLIVHDAFQADANGRQGRGARRHRDLYHTVEQERLVSFERFGLHEKFEQHAQFGVAQNGAELRDIAIRQRSAFRLQAEGII